MTICDDCKNNDKKLNICKICMIDGVNKEISPRQVECGVMNKDIGYNMSIIPTKTDEELKIEELESK